MQEAISGPPQQPKASRTSKGTQKVANVLETGMTAENPKLLYLKRPRTRGQTDTAAAERVQTSMADLLDTLATEKSLKRRKPQK
jgi:hypothetical protein